MGHAGRAGEAFDEPVGPHRGVAAGFAGVECLGEGIGPVLTGRVACDEPFLQVPEHPSSDAAKDGAEGFGRVDAAWIGEIQALHLPVDHVGAAGSKGAERQPGHTIQAEFQSGAFETAALCQGDVSRFGRGAGGTDGRSRIIGRIKARHACLSDTPFSEPVGEKRASLRVLPAKRRFRDDRNRF